MTSDQAFTVGLSIGIGATILGLAALYLTKAWIKALQIVSDRMSDEPDMNAWPVKNERLVPPHPKDPATGRFIKRTDAMAERLRSELGRQA